MSHGAIELFQVDAFTSRAFGGNPAAVCLLDAEAPAEWMQSVAAERNLSETAFVRAVSGGWELRWFTPAAEVRLCGHATLAAGHALWESGRVGAAARSVRFQTLAGELEVSRDDRAYRLALPRIGLEPLALDSTLGRSTGARSLFRTVGPGDPDVLAELPSEDAVRRFAPDLELLERERVGLIVTARADGPDFVSRYFAPSWGIDEDPVTGSAHAALFPFWVNRVNRVDRVDRIGRTDRAGRRPLRAEQASARGGFMTGVVESGSVRLRGEAVTVVRGRLTPAAAPPALR